MVVRFVSSGIALVLFTLVPAGMSEGTGTLSFNRDIRPILSDKCFFCHGPDEAERKAGLRLDLRAEAIDGGAIVPGEVKESELYWRITSTDRSEVMPPPETHKSLTPREVETLVRWIEEGAEYENHWAWQPVERPEAPESGPAAIDHFVDRALAELEWERRAEAGDVVLARRLSFDLVGLPPSADDFAFFRKAGIEPYVDRLLASPHFGERMAVEWLDAVRYADTVGYHGDQSRDASPFRDYIITAFNDNLPFDQFTIEQLAGDLLPEATLQQRVASAFSRLNPVSNEGGIQDAEYLAKYQAERVRTTSTAWLGNTLACAECHDHKYDPFLAEDFYRFAAYFADILEKGAYTGVGSYQEDTARYARDGLHFGKFGPEWEVPTAEQEKELERLAADLAEAEAAFREMTPEREAALVRWAGEQRAAAASGEAFDYVYLGEKGEKNDVSVGGVKFVTARTGRVREGSFARLQESDGLVQHIVNATKKPLVLAEGETLFAWVWLDPEDPPEAIMLQFHHEKTTWNHRARWGRDAISYGRGPDRPAHRQLGELPPRGEWIRLEVAPGDVGLKPGDRITQLAFTQFGGRVFWDDTGVHTRDEKRRWQGVPEPVKEALAVPAGEWNPGQRNAVVAYWRDTAPDLAPERAAVTSLRSRREQVKNGMRTVPATIAAQRREVRVLPRGDWMDKSGPVVTPAPPHFLPPSLPDAVGENATRLELARWIAHRDNPLTARTFVNRLWARFFGSGISAVLNDLGSQGEWPTHPELLDWLAAEFMESGWDVKHIVRTIVLSETYRQSSESDPALQEKDPYNRHLARQSQIRLPAEFIRDNALAVSGLLQPRVGGASVRPYQPAGYYQHLNFPRRVYQPDTGENQYRRGLYTHWQRTFLHPSLIAFDAPAREESCMAREESSTPLQALTLLNDPSHVEAARVLAENESSIEAMFRRVLSRDPEPEEKAVLVDLYEKEKTRFRYDEAAADSLLAVGMKKTAVEGEARFAAAARTSVARTLLNLHETNTRF